MCVQLLNGAGTMAQWPTVVWFICRHQIFTQGQLGVFVF